MVRPWVAHTGCLDLEMRKGPSLGLLGRQILFLGGKTEPELMN